LQERLQQRDRISVRPRPFPDRGGSRSCRSPADASALVADVPPGDRRHCGWLPSGCGTMLRRSSRRR